MSNPKTNEGNGVVGKVLAGAAIVGAGVVAAKLVNDHKDDIKGKVEEVKEKGSEMVDQIKGDTLDAVNKTFNDLRTRIQESEQAKDFSGRVTFIADGLKKIKESNEDDMSALLTKVKEQVADLQKDFEERERERNLEQK